MIDISVLLTICLKESASNVSYRGTVTKPYVQQAKSVRIHSIELGRYKPTRRDPSTLRFSLAAAPPVGSTPVRVINPDPTCLTRAPNSSKVCQTHAPLTFRAI